MRRAVLRVAAGLGCDRVATHPEGLAPRSSRASRSPPFPAPPESQKRGFPSVPSVGTAGRDHPHSGAPPSDRGEAPDSSRRSSEPAGFPPPGSRCKPAERNQFPQSDQTLSGAFQVHPRDILRSLVQPAPGDPRGSPEEPQETERLFSTPVASPPPQGPKQFSEGEKGPPKPVRGTRECSR